MPDIESVVAQARAGIVRVTADELAARLAAGAWVIDIRPVDRRQAAGHIPGAVVVDRLVLEWRLDPTSAHRMRPGLDVIPTSAGVSRLLVVASGDPGASPG